MATTAMIVPHGICRVFTMLDLTAATPEGFAPFFRPPLAMILR
ncbi:hypothetical protein [Haloechinothrix aidingensis]|nr:hypothetical protein [Haloechinothrix aidingensis]